jgi:uncharacterized protein YegP (UPF0339 family)
MIEILTSQKRKLNFVVKSNAGETLLTSVDFKNQEEIETTVQKLTAATSTLNKVERKTNFEGKFLFHLKDEHGRLLGSSGLYTSEAGMENGIKNLTRNLF